MIPGTVLLFTIEWKEQKLEARAMDPVPCGISFRTAKSRRADFEIQPEAVNFCFLSYEEKSYVSFRLTDFTIALQKETEDALYYTLTSENPVFLKRLAGTLSAYLSYIRMRLDTDEEEMMENVIRESRKKTLCTQKSAEDKKGDRGEKREKARKEAREEEKEELLPCEVALSLDCREFTEKFPELPFEDFLQYYVQKNAPAEKLLKNCRVTHLYIGSQFCLRLFPDPDRLEKILIKAGHLSLAPVICLPPMRESGTQTFRNIYRFLFEKKREYELVLNDVGAVLLLEEMKKEQKTGADRLHCTAGIFLNKRAKDPRLSFVRKDSTRAERLMDSSADSEKYRAFLSGTGIERFSYETPGFLTGIAAPDAVLHLPLYQTNTAGFCTLAAAVKYGDRGRQIPDEDCNFACEKYQLIYPEEYGIRSRWNSLFGFDERAASDMGYLNELIRNGVSRLVIRA